MPLNLVVIGGGPGGYEAALEAAKLGAQVTLIEAAGLGGTCLHRGCIPTKTIRASAELLEKTRRLAEFGLSSDGPARPDMAAIMARKEQVVAVQEKGIEKLLANAKVELLRGRGRLAAPDLVRVELNQGGERELACDRVILATGSRPLDLPGLECDGRLVLNSDHALQLERIPASLAVIGGGVVGCEFACIMAALGSQVTVIEALDRLLPIPSLDEQASKLILREMKKRKIKAHLGMVVKECAPGEKGVRLSLEASPLVEHKRPPKPLELTVDQVLVSVGRGLNSQGLGLEQAGVELGQRGEIKVNPHLQTTTTGVYAIGDVLGPSRPMLAHMASAEAKVAAANALGGDRRPDYQVVPAVAFTFPEVAWVGLSTAQAAEQGIETRTHSYLFRQLGMSQALGEIAGQATLISRAEDGRLLGAFIVGAQAGELIHECALGLHLGATVEDIAQTIHAHPTLSEVLPLASH